jgi:hypothetical protein
MVMNSPRIYSEDATRRQGVEMSHLLFMAHKKYHTTFGHVIPFRSLSSQCDDNSYSSSLMETRVVWFGQKSRQWKDMTAETLGRRTNGEGNG